MKNSIYFLISHIQKYPVINYILLAFSITWGLKLLYANIKGDEQLPALNLALLASYGPSIAALTLVAITDGKTGIHRLVKSVLNWKVGWKWILIALLFEFIMFQVITIGYWIKYHEFPIIYGHPFYVSIFSFFGVFIPGIFFWGLSEEIGWRGWMFPKLQDKLSPFWASILLAVFTSLWHMDPSNLQEMFICSEGINLWGCYPPVVERLIISIPMVLVITYIYNNAQGSLLVMMIFHSSSNTSYFWTEEIFGIIYTTYFKLMFLVILGVLFIVFSILVINTPKKVSFKNLQES